jgi:hypothetical protein
VDVAREEIRVRDQSGRLVFLMMLVEPGLGYSLPAWVQDGLVGGRWELTRHQVADAPPEAREGFEPPDWKTTAEALHDALVQVRAEAEQMGRQASADSEENEYALDPETLAQARAAIDRYDVACMAYAELHPEAEDRPEDDGESQTDD